MAARKQIRQEVPARHEKTHDTPPNPTTTAQRNAQRNITPTGAIRRAKTHLFVLGID